MENQEAPEINADEAAAQAIQEAIWLEEELGDPEVAQQLFQNANGGMPELVRQLLRERRAGAHNNNNNPENNEPNNEGEENVIDEDDEMVDGEAVDAGVAGEVFDESQNRITRPVKCPLVSLL